MRTRRVSRESPCIDQVSTYITRSLPSARMTTDAEIWRVQLPTGELRAFSLDALDEAFDAGLIHGGTPVLAPGATSWAPLSVVAGLDATEPAMTQTPSLSPVAISYGGQDIATLPPPAPAPYDLDAISDDALKP